MTLGRGRKNYFKNGKVFAFLAFLVFAVYLNSLGNDFVSDDLGTIRDNPLLGKFEYLTYFKFNLRSIIIFFTHQLFGLQPVFYRLSNLLFHFGSSCLIYLLLALSFTSPLPLIAASLFAVHPLLIEGVGWISGGPYSNGAFFLLLSLLTYSLAIKEKRPKLYPLSIISFFLAGLTSQKLIFFPLVLLIYEFCFGNLKSNWKKSLPFWVISGFWGLYVLGLFGARTTTLKTTFYQEPGINNPLIQIPVAIASYLELAFWPKNLTLYHAKTVFTPTEYLLKLAIFILFLVIIGFFFKKDRRVFFWLLFFPLSLLPTLTPLRVGWVVAERYVYLGALGIFVLMAWLIKKIGDLVKNKQVTLALFVFLLLIFSLRTIIRNADWKDADTLWLATAKTSPLSPQNHNNLGDLYSRQGNYEKAIEEFQTAIQLKPNYGDAYHNLGNVYYAIGEDKLAIENYQKAISLNPNLWQSYQNIAAILFKHQEYEAARENLEKAIAINPQNPELYTVLGIFYLSQDEKEMAKETFLKALQLDPENQRAKQLFLSL